MIQNKILNNFLSKIDYDNGVYTIIVEPNKYNETCIELAAFLNRKFKLPGIYVSLNKPSTIVLKMCSKLNIDTEKILFIDWEGKSINKNNHIVLNGKSLTELSIALSGVCNNTDMKYILFDSLNILLIYDPLVKIQKFVQFLINKARNLEVLMFLIIVKEKKANDLIPTLTYFSDKSIKI